jgi:hypothetical protein
VSLTVLNRHPDGGNQSAPQKQVEHAAGAVGADDRERG